ncbi:MAG: hypothetical protein K6T83_23965, partial [Alicyclobacillus sp.]|nr:hypothetical protein [Alicyclobacillus sp.]
FQYQQNQNDGNGWITAVVDANTGRITAYSRPTEDNEFKFPVPVSADRAKQVALQWAKKLYPDQVNQVQVLPLTPQLGSLNGPMMYTYQFQRVVNGIPAPFDGFSITIDQDGHLISANDNWTNITFPASDNAITQTQANQIYQKSLNLHLVYSMVYRNNGKAQTELLYVPADTTYAGWWGQTYSAQAIGQPVINALTGSIIDATGKTHQPPTYQPPKPLVPGGPTWPAKPKHVNWTESEALAYAKKVLAIPASDKLVSVNEYSNPGSDATWNFQWQAPDKTIVNAAVDATLGVLTNFNEYIKQPASKSASTAKPTQTQINAAVTAFIKRVYAGDTGGLALVPSTDPNSKLVTSFQLVPLVNGIADQSRQGNLNVNPKTGQVENLWMNFAPETSTLPAPSKAVPVAQATQTVLQKHPMTLMYLLTQPQSVPGENQYAASKVVLVYAPTWSNGVGEELNAVTGRFE